MDYFVRLIIVFSSLIIICYSPLSADNKYSERANVAHTKHFVDEKHVNMRNIEKPFRMAKLNMLWSKAQVRLTEPKLKSLYSELKVHDKEEIAWKRLRSEGMDKEGLKEADLRSKLTGIMSTYGLLEHFDDVQNSNKAKYHEPYTGKSDKYRNKSLFKDKKLNKLWEKAEISGFTAEELQALKEEFLHHQEKVDQYYSILNSMEAKDPNEHLNSVDEKLVPFNEIASIEQDELEMRENSYLAKANRLRESHMELRDDFDRLYRKAVSGPKSQEFTEPKVQGLWKQALSANFSSDELNSLKSELFHYEKRLLKLRHMHVEAALEAEKRKNTGNKVPHHYDSIPPDEIKKHTRKVAKLHTDIEERIFQRLHSEL